MITTGECILNTYLNNNCLSIKEINLENLTSLHSSISFPQIGFFTAVQNKNSLAGVSQQSSIDFSKTMLRYSSWGYDFIPLLE